MGRAVGGAAGAGCAGFSLVGVLLTIGIVVWLGSTVAQDVGGGGSDSKPKVNPLSPSAAADLTIPGATFAGAAVRITTPPPLQPGQVVEVIGSGFPPGPLEVSTCLTKSFRSTDGAAGCDPATNAPITAGEDGTFTLDYPVTRVMAELGIGYDCAAFAEACSLVAHPKDAFDDGPTAALTFAPDLPPVTAERPPDH